MPMRLNKEQKAAVTHTGSPLLVSAGPGSGKTKVITHRVKFLMEKKKLQASQILCLTFSNKAVQVMRNDLDKLMKDAADVEISTYHSFCSRILRDYAANSSIGAGPIVPRPSFLVWGLENIDSFKFDDWIEMGNNAAELIEKMIDGISTFKDELLKPDEIKKYVDKEIGKITINTDAEDVQRLHELDNLVKIYRKYDEHKRRQGVLDFDDLVVLAHDLLDNPKKKHVINHLHKKYRHILIDEFQDNNYAQFSIVKKLVAGGNVTAVGDADQSIYRFQGAYPEIFKDFVKSFRGVKTINLVKNYRNIKSVVSLSGELLKQDASRAAKKIKSDKPSRDRVFIAECEGEATQAEFIKDKIIELKRNNRKLSNKDFAVLSRKQSGGMLIANTLKSAGIPVNYVGKSNIFNSPSAKMLISYLNVVADPANSGRYIDNILDDYGVPMSDITAINEEARGRAWNSAGDCVLDVLSDLKMTAKKVRLKNGKVVKKKPRLSAKGQIMEVHSFLKKLIDAAKNGTVAKTVFEISREHTTLMRDTTYEDTFENFIERSILIDLERDASDLQVLKPDCSMKDFLKYLTALQKFEIETEQGSQFPDSVQVSTIHQSKGKEFAHVFVANVGTRQIPLDYQEKMFYVPKGLAKGLYPAADPKEFFTNEERRILYVGMTRSIESLHMTFNSKTASERRRNISEFLEKLDPENNRNVRHSVEVPDANTGSDPPARTPADVIKNKTLALAVKNITSGQYASAMQKIVDLDAIRHYKAKKTTAGSKLAKSLKMKPSTRLEKSLRGMKVDSIDISKMEMSASRMGRYDTCPKQFKFQYVWKVPGGGTNANLYAGNRFHEVTRQDGESEKQGAHKTKAELKKMLDSEWDYREFLDDGKTTEKQYKSRMKNALAVYKQWAKSNPNTVVDVERDFTIKIGRAVVKGRIDRVEKTPAGKYHVVDFKTGTGGYLAHGVKKDIQLNVYCLACKKLYGELPERATLFYPEITPAIELKSKGKKKRFKHYDVTDARVKLATTDILMKIINGIKKMNFTAKPSMQKCKWCDYRPICTEAI